MNQPQPSSTTYITPEAHAFGVSVALILAFIGTTILIDWRTLHGVAPVGS
jgi:hypothetical protein